MNGRQRKKRKKQAYVEGLERGNRYLKDAMLRQDQNYSKRLRSLAMENELLEMLLYAAVIQAGGFVAIETKGLADMLAKKEISQRADAEAHMVHIEVKDKEQA